MVADTVLFGYTKKLYKDRPWRYFFWYPKERGDLKTIHDKNDVLTDDELVVVRDLLKNSKHTCLCIRKEYPCGFCAK